MLKDRATWKFRINSPESSLEPRIHRGDRLLLQLPWPPTFASRGQQINFLSLNPFLRVCFWETPREAQKGASYLNGVVLMRQRDCGQQMKW